MDLVLLFPGQGSQKPGMAADLATAFPTARDVLQTVDDALDTPLSRLMFDGPAEELTLTHNAQPALLAHGIAAWRVLEEALGARVVAAAGHSLGEFTAYTAAGACSVADGARLVRRRGELMYDAGTERPGAMAAVVGTLARPIEEICDAASADAGLVVPANYNCPGQIVISGEVGGVERAMALAKTAGAKLVTRLNVSGAFHSPLMAPAAAGFADALGRARFSDARFPIYANVSAEPIVAAGQARRLLLRQLTSPVRWMDIIERLAAKHPDALYVEVGPGSVLRGLVRKICPSLRTAGCGTTGDLATLIEQPA